MVENDEQNFPEENEEVDFVDNSNDQVDVSNDSNKNVVEAVDENEPFEQKYLFALVDLDEVDAVHYDDIFGDANEDVEVVQVLDVDPLNISPNVANGPEETNIETNGQEDCNASGGILNDSNTLGAFVPAENEKMEVIEGKIKVTRYLEDDIFLTYIVGEDFTPLKPLYEVKLNDIISENIPFKENVRK